MREGVCILGSTGSIGTSTLDVIKRNAKRFKVEVLTANKNIEKLVEQCAEFKPELVVIADESQKSGLEALLQKHSINVKVMAGEQALVDSVSLPSVKTVVAAIVGAAGLLPTLAAVNQGHKILLANKEALVMSGEIFTQAVEKSGAILLPVDSEHNAIFQSLASVENQTGYSVAGVNKILLTGSGGPFRNKPLHTFDKITPAEACAHPNWDMGRKISVDSATMMNKGLELIEACFLFGVSLEQIEIVVHPQSIVHSMVSFLDGSVISQMGQPDMRTPIAHALAWPDRINAGVEPLDFYKMSDLSFEAPDYLRFPCLKLAERAMQRKGAAPCVLNAANEISVEAFLNEQLKFSDIAKVNEVVLEQLCDLKADSLETVLKADSVARTAALDVIGGIQ